MNVMELLETARQGLGVKQVYGDPIEVDRTIIIPAARVAGGAGGGGGQDHEGQSGEGGGFGLGGRPAGAYVLRDGNVRWQPAVDVNRMVAAVAAVLVVHLLTRPRMARLRLKARMAGAAKDA